MKQEPVFVLRIIPVVVLGKRIEIAGGLILVAIGVNILFTHIFVP